jgi:hypothetical protein
MEIVGSEPKAGQDAAYLEYYVDHFTKMFQYGGIREISYVRIFMPMAQDGKNHGYVTVYDFESEAAMNDFYKCSIFKDAKQD